MRRSLIWLSTVLTIVLMGSIGVQAATNLTIWDWVDWRVDILRDFVDQYEKVNPDVKITVEVQPDMWAKLRVALVGGAPPDIMQFHNEQYGVFGEYLSPFPEALFPPARMARDYLLFDTIPINGRMYFHPYAINGPVIFYNVSLLGESGMQKPAARWSEMVEQSKKLTRVHADGRVAVAGFGSPRTMALWTDLVYQLGGYLFGPENKADLTSPQAIQARDFLVQWRDANVGLYDELSFPAGSAAMRYHWIYETVGLRNSSVDWSVSTLPLFDEHTRARGRLNWAIGLAVTNLISADKQAEAFKFIKWLYDQEDYHVRLCERQGLLPAYRPVLNRFLRQPAFQALSQQVSASIYPGAFPSWYTVQMNSAWARIAKGENPQVVFQEAKVAMDAAWETERPNYIIERQWVPAR